MISDIGHFKTTLNPREKWVSSPVSSILDHFVMTESPKQWLNDIYEFLIWEIFGPGCDLHLRQSRSDLQNRQHFLLAVDRQL